MDGRSAGLESCAVRKGRTRGGAFREDATEARIGRRRNQRGPSALTVAQPLRRFRVVDSDQPTGFSSSPHASLEVEPNVEVGSRVPNPESRIPKREHEPRTGTSNTNREPRTLEPGTCGVVPVPGLEPGRPKTRAPKTRASANSARPALRTRPILARMKTHRGDRRGAENAGASGQTSATGRATWCAWWRFAPTDREAAGHAHQSAPRSSAARRALRLAFCQ